MAKSNGNEEKEESQLKIAVRHCLSQTVELEDLGFQVESFPSNLIGFKYFKTVYESLVKGCSFFEKYKNEESPRFDFTTKQCFGGIH